MNDLRKKLIRLAHANPDLRPRLLPLLKKGSKHVPPPDAEVAQIVNHLTKDLLPTADLARKIMIDTPLAGEGQAAYIALKKARDAWLSIMKKL